MPYWRVMVALNSLLLDCFHVFQQHVNLILSLDVVKCWKRISNTACASDLTKTWKTDLRPPSRIHKAYQLPFYECCFIAIDICIKTSQTHGPVSGWSSLSINMGDTIVRGDHHTVGPWGCEGSAQIVTATNGGQNKIRKLAFRSPLVALIRNKFVELDNLILWC